MFVIISHVIIPILIGVRFLILSIENGKLYLILQLIFRRV